MERRDVTSVTAGLEEKATEMTSSALSRDVIGPIVLGLCLSGSDVTFSSLIKL